MPELGRLLHAARQALAGDDRQRSANKAEVESRKPDRTSREGAGAGAQSFVQPILHELLDHLLVRLRHLPVQKVVGSNVTPSLLPRASVGDQSDPGVGAHAEVVAALAADVVVLSHRLQVERDTAARAVGRQRDLRELASRDAKLGRGLGQRVHSDSPPSTAITCPVMNPARSEQRKATAAAMSSAVPSRLIGVSLTSSPTISSVSDPAVSSVRT